MVPDLIGRTIGSYRIESIIGSGGMGTVYLGVHPSIGSRVAIKVLSRESFQEAQMVDRFFVEAKAVNAIHHENVVNILDMATLPDGRPYIVMEYLDGAPLSNVIKVRGPLPLGSLARAACEVLDALGAAHRAGIVHRDLKPDNIVITRNGRAKVLDFGTAKLMPTLDITQVQTQTGHVLGTPSYMAPEQILDSLTVDSRTDIYAMGILLFEGATGRKPFDAPFLFDVLQMQIQQAPPAPRSLRPALPPGYEAVILTAMAKESDQRYLSAYDMGHALNQAVAELPDPEWDSLGQRPDGRHITISPEHRVSSSHAVPGQSPPHPVQPAPASGPYVRATGPQRVSGPHAQASGPHARVTGARSQQNVRGVRTVVIAIAAAAIGAVLAAVLVGDAGTGVDSSDGGMVGVTGQPGPTSEQPGPASEQPGPASEQPGPASERPGPPTGPSSKPDAEPGQGHAGELTRPHDATLAAIDARQFEVLGFLDRATARARAVHQDAALISIKAYPVVAGGTADLTAQRAAEVIYAFRSPGRSESTERRSNRSIATGRACRVRVKVGWDSGREVATLDVTAQQSRKCDEPILRRPRCTLRQLWTKAMSRGAPSSPDAAALVEYWTMGARRTPRWDIQVGSGADKFHASIRDRCASN